VIIMNTKAKFGDRTDKTNREEMSKRKQEKRTNDYFSTIEKKLELYENKLRKATMNLPDWETYKHSIGPPKSYVQEETAKKYFTEYATYLKEVLKILGSVVEYINFDDVGVSIVFDPREINLFNSVDFIRKDKELLENTKGMFYLGFDDITEPVTGPYLTPFYIIKNSEGLYNAINQTIDFIPERWKTVLSYFFNTTKIFPDKEFTDEEKRTIKKDLKEAKETLESNNLLVSILNVEKVKRSIRKSA